MPRRNVSVVMDVNESVKQLENELRTLTTQKQNLLTNVKELEQTRDKLTVESNSLAEKISKTEKESKEKCEKMLAIAEEKLAKANTREGQTVEAQSVLKDKIKVADDLIKSNEGLQKNLKIQEDASMARLKRISELADLIKISVKDI